MAVAQLERQQGCCAKHAPTPQPRKDDISIHEKSSIAAHHERSLFGVDKDIGTSQTPLENIDNKLEDVVVVEGDSRRRRLHFVEGGRYYLSCNTK